MAALSVHRRRTASIRQHLLPAQHPERAAAAAELLPLVSGGFDKIDWSHQPPAFDAASPIDSAEAAESFSEHGYLMLTNALSDSLVTEMNDCIDRSMREMPVAWGLVEDEETQQVHNMPGQGHIFYPILDYPVRTGNALWPLTCENRSFCQDRLWAYT
jgi:hypothetical protein